MSPRPTYVVDDQKRITLGPLIEPGERYDVETREDSLILIPSPAGRVKADPRRRISLGRLALAGAIYRADLYADGRIVLGPLLLVDPTDMDMDLRAAIQDYLIE